MQETDFLFAQATKRTALVSIQKQDTVIQKEGLDQRNGKITEICVDLQRMNDVLTEPVLLKEKLSSAKSALNSQVEEDMRRNDSWCPVGVWSQLVECLQLKAR